MISENDLKKLSDVEWLQANPQKEKLFLKLAEKLKPVKVRDNFEIETILQAMVLTGEMMIEENKAAPVQSQNAFRPENGGLLEQTDLVDTVADAKKVSEMILDFTRQQREEFKEEIDLYLNVAERVGHIRGGQTQPSSTTDE
jgi:hypothetical protein